MLLLAAMTGAKAEVVAVEGIGSDEIAQYDIDAIQCIDLTQADTVRIITVAGESFAYAKAQAPRLNFTAVASGIGTVENAATTGRVRVWTDGSALFIDGTREGDAVAVFSVNGVRLASGHAAQGTTRIDVSTLPNGVYVVKAGKQAAKFIIR